MKSDELPKTGDLFNAPDATALAHPTGVLQSQDAGESVGVNGARSNTAQIASLTERSRASVAEKRPSILSEIFPQMSRHPLAMCLPRDYLDKYSAIEESIRKHGADSPVVIYQGKILDGWKTYCACLALKIECPKVVFDGPDPVMFLIERNLRPRAAEITDDQRVMAVVHMFDQEGRLPEDDSEDEALYLALAKAK